jgi:hypothetical protein
VNDSTLVGQFLGIQSQEITILCDPDAGIPGNLTSVKHDTSASGEFNWYFTWNTSFICPILPTTNIPDDQITPSQQPTKNNQGNTAKTVIVTLLSVFGILSVIIVGAVVAFKTSLTFRSTIFRYLFGNQQPHYSPFSSANEDAAYLTENID